MAYTASDKVRAPDGLHPAYATYGDNAATAVLSRIGTLPPKQQPAALRRPLNTIDPSLMKRTQDIAARYQKQGMAPAQALHAGLSRAMATGILAEVMHLGRTGERPKKRTQVGLGAYGVGHALGDISAAQLTATQVNVGKLPATNVPIQGACTADGFIYKNGSWQRKGTTDTCSSTFTGPGGTVSVHNADGSITTTYPDGTVVTTGPMVTTTGQGKPGDFKGPFPITYDFSGGDASSSAPNAASQSLQVGPFLVPMGAKQFTIHWSGQMPADWTSFITQELAHDCSNCIFTSMEDATPGHVMGVLRDFFGNALPSKVNKDLVTVVAAYIDPATQKPRVKITLPDQPIAMVSRPDNGEVWGMFMVVSPKDPTYPWDSTTNPYELQFWWRKRPQGVWDWIKKIVGVIIDAVVDAVNAVAGLACDLLSSSAGQAGAVVGGAVIGGTAGGPKGAQAGAQVGAAGAAIANKECSQPVVTLPPQGSSWLVPAALIGGGAILIAVLNKRKKATTTP
jgi:hypothetical protein